MSSAALGARDLFQLVRKGIDPSAVSAHVRKPFRFLLCGDPALVADLRTMLLSGHADATIPPEAAACLETIGANTANAPPGEEARAILFLGRPGDFAGADFSKLSPLDLPILGVTVDPGTPPSGPATPPLRGAWAEYVVPALSAQALRARLFPHLVECARGVEIAVGRALPPLRESVAAKLTRDAAGNSLKVAIASAVVDHIPVVGLVLGAMASAGDMVAITGIQIVLLMHIEAAYGKDPDVQRLWKLLPVIGGGLGWRTLARELSGFVPVAGIAIKGAIAYAGTIVVGEGVTFFLEHGDHMTKQDAALLYERTKDDALRFARELITKFRNR
ncbi:MAG TPA: hypothetical protein VIN40_01360 [Candidatus Tyrphobacter sp.]